MGTAKDTQLLLPRWQNCSERQQIPLAVAIGRSQHPARNKDGVRETSAQRDCDDAPPVLAHWLGNLGPAACGGQRALALGVALMVFLQRIRRRCAIFANIADLKAQRFVLLRRESDQRGRPPRRLPGWRPPSPPAATGLFDSIFGNCSCVVLPRASMPSPCAGRKAVDLLSGPCGRVVHDLPPHK